VAASGHLGRSRFYREIGRSGVVRGARTHFSFGGPNKKYFPREESRVRFGLNQPLLLAGGLNARALSRKYFWLWSSKDKNAFFLAVLPISRSPCESRRFSRRPVGTTAARGARATWPGNAAAASARRLSCGSPRADEIRASLLGGGSLDGVGDDDAVAAAVLGLVQGAVGTGK
jgi:hypothetical protein